MEQSTVHFEDIVNITVDSSSVILQEKQNDNQEDHNRQINPCDLNEVNKSTQENASETFNKP